MAALIVTTLAHAGPAADAFATAARARFDDETSLPRLTWTSSQPQ